MDPLDRAEADSGLTRLAEFSAPFKKELTGVIDRLISEAAHELDAVLERAEAQSDSTLRAAEAALAEQRQRHDDLAESFAKGGKQIEELRLELEREREHALTATQAYEGAESARIRAEAACEEARAVREGMVSAYESRLQAVHEELETMRATTVTLQQQLEAEAAERARLVATIRSVQQAFAAVEPATAAPDNRAPRNNVTDVTVNVNTVTPTGDRTHHDETPAIASSADRCLTLIASTPAPPPITAPRPLLDYLGQLFGQIEAIYEEDQRSRPLTEVVDRLTANLRCARDLFVKRANTDGVSGAALFDQQLSERLNGSTETPLIRHLAIAAHELAHSEESYRRAEAS
jgi:hypothetical protein